ncbi:MAG TPA: ATP-binding protein [Micromonosporaceae bacterium]|nr:ATP-binding protein [Micromonosporaceae bacterium]
MTPFTFAPARAATEPLAVRAVGRVASLTPKRRNAKTPKPTVDLRLREVAGHLTYTGATVTAWYAVPEQQWAFRPDAERAALMGRIAKQYAGLAGARLHLRRTTRPYPVSAWLTAHHGNTDPAAANTAEFAAHLSAATKHLDTAQYAEGSTLLGVEFARRNLGDTAGEWMMRRLRGGGVARSEQQRLTERVHQYDTLLAAPGMAARPATPTELSWLLYRSVGLGLAPLDAQITTLGPDDIMALTERVLRFRTSYGATTRLVDRLTGQESHVAVLTVGRMEPLDIPEVHQPWLHLADELTFPVEVSSRVEVVTSSKSLEQRLRIIRSQQKDYAEHGLDSPPELERLAARALDVTDQVSTGLVEDAARAHGWHRLAVSGATEAEVLERVGKLRAHYSENARIDLHHPKDQDRLCAEFIPGEPTANTGYLRRMPVALLAAAVPQAATTVGDRRGDLLGYTAGTGRRPVMWDPHYAMEVSGRSGLAVLVSDPGGGKSTLLGATGYLAALRGVQTTILDPSGPLARLAELPSMAGKARVLNLAGSKPGTLAPFALIPTPRRGDYPFGAQGDLDFEEAVAEAKAERKMLVLDLCRMLLPPSTAALATTETVLRDAIRKLPAEETTTLDDLVKVLLDGGDTAHDVANLLLDAAEMPRARLFFGSPPSDVVDTTAPLTIITMAGLHLPDLSVDRAYWSVEESLAVPMLHTAHRLAVRRCYGGEMGQRKFVGLDEAHFLEGWGSGRSFLRRLARDSRKWNLAALVASQNPKDILGLDVQNLVSSVFVGRISEDSEIGAEALRLLRIPCDVGYEATLAGLSSGDEHAAARLGFREFVMRDVGGRVQKIRVDVSYVPELLRYLNTTPGGAR